MIIYDHIWTYIIIYDHIWSYMIINDRIWSYMIINSHILSYMIICDHVWSYMIIYDRVWSCMMIFWAQHVRFQNLCAGFFLVDFCQQTNETFSLLIYIYIYIFIYTYIYIYKCIYMLYCSLTICTLATVILLNYWYFQCPQDPWVYRKWIPLN